MNKHATRFPWLASDAQLADVQVRQTLAMGLVPLGRAALLAAASFPETPGPGLWIGAGMAAGGMGMLWGMWRKSGGGPLKGYSTAHFLVRYGLILLCPALLWQAFGDLVLEKAGPVAPALAGVLLVLYPAGRILRERLGEGGPGGARAAMAWMVCRQLQTALGTVAAAAGLSGAIVDAHRDYPTDPTPLLMVIWMLALVATLASAAAAAAEWNRLYGKPRMPQPLDDPPPAGGAKNPVNFGSDRF